MKKRTLALAGKAALIGLAAGIAACGSSTQENVSHLQISGVAGQGAPVVYEDNPTFQNLIGRTEHLARFGALITDFNLIQAGAMHRASGGYLILDAERLIAGGFGWAALKRALQSGELRIESIEQALSVASTVSLQPEPIPLDVKVVLVGSPLLLSGCSNDDDASNSPGRSGTHYRGGGFHFFGGSGGRSGGSSGSAVHSASPRGGFGGFGHFGGFGG